MQIGSADTRSGDPDNGVLGMKNLGHGFMIDADAQRPAIIHCKQSTSFLDEPRSSALVPCQEIVPHDNTSRYRWSQVSETVCWLPSGSQRSSIFSSGEIHQAMVLL